MRRRRFDNVLESLVGKASRPRGKTSRPCMWRGVWCSADHSSGDIISFFFLLLHERRRPFLSIWSLLLSELTRSSLANLGNGIMPFLLSLSYIIYGSHAFERLSQRTHGGRTLGQLRLIYGNPGGLLPKLRGNELVLGRSNPWASVTSSLGLNLLAFEIDIHLDADNNKSFG